MEDAVALIGDFSVTGRASLTTVTAAAGRRHFTVAGSHTLTLKWLRLTGSDISNNSDPHERGGAVRVDSSASLLAEACAFVGNKAKWGGSITGYGKITLLNTNITDSEVTTAGGGCYCASGSMCSFTNVLIKGNTARWGGGGVMLYKSTLHMRGSTVEANTATENGGGGGVRILYSTASINETRFYKNEAQYFGGGIYVYGNIADGPSALTMRRSVLEENEQTSTAGDAVHGGGGLYVEYNSSAVLRETTLIGNRAKADSAGPADHGHQIMTHKANSAYATSLAVALINSNVTATAGNFYGYNEGDMGSVENYIGTKTCGTFPLVCAIFPFTGTCTNRTGNLGVLCNYDEATTCPASEYKQFVSVENGLPPSSATCADTKPEWDCAAARGVFKRTEDCYMSSQVVLTGDLNIVGRENVYTKLVAAPNSRHFYVDDHSLTVRWLNLTGGNVSQGTPCDMSGQFGTGISVSNCAGGSVHVLGSGAVSVSYCTFVSNTASYGGSIYGRNGVNINLIETIMTNNVALGDGGGILISDAGSTLRATSSQIYQNKATREVPGSIGGGLFCYHFAVCELTNCSIDENKAYNGGGIYHGEGGRLTVNNNSFISRNIAFYSGGGIKLFRGIHALANSRIYANTAGSEGGGIYLGGTLECQRLLPKHPSGNQANHHGCYLSMIYNLFLSIN
jgi:hypothetical protein